MPALTLTIAVQAQAIKAACAKYAVPLQVFMGMYNEETSLGTDVTTSSTGAIGPFQFEPATAGQYGYPLTNTPNEGEFQAQAMAAAHLLSDNYQQFHSWQDALAAYNAGPGNIGAGQGYASAALAFTIPGNWVSALGSAPGVPVLDNTSAAGLPKTTTWGDDFAHNHFDPTLFPVPGGDGRYKWEEAALPGFVLAPHTLSAELLTWFDSLGGLPVADFARASVSALVTAAGTVAVGVRDLGIVQGAGLGAGHPVIAWPEDIGMIGGLAPTVDGARSPGAQATAWVAAAFAAPAFSPSFLAAWAAHMPTPPYTVVFEFDSDGRFRLEIADATAGPQVFTDGDAASAIGGGWHTGTPPDAARLKDWRQQGIDPSVFLGGATDRGTTPFTVTLSEWSWEVDSGGSRPPGLIVPGGQQGGSVRGIGRVTGGAQQLPAQLVQQAVSLGIITPAQAGKIQPGGQQGGSQRTLISPSGGS